MPVKSGRYIITNVKQRNLAFLPDPNDGTPLQASHGKDVLGELWKVTRHKNGCHSIVNVGHDERFANGGSRATAGDNVEGSDREQLWDIRETRVRGQYTIATTDTHVFWTLLDNQISTPVTLYNINADSRSWWTFTDPDKEFEDVIAAAPSHPKERIPMAVGVRTNLKIASFDAGGVRSLSQLEMMKTIMHQVSWEMNPSGDTRVLPCEYFDMIGGSDTGGLIAIMLVKLKMSVEETIDEFQAIIKEVYAKDLEPAARTEGLRRCMESILQKCGKTRELKLEDEEPSSCKCFVLAASYNNPAHKACLRTYRVRRELPSEITVVDAVLATCAAQPYFLPASFEVGSRPLKYVGADLAASNPIRHVITEAQSLFGGDSIVSSLLSLGSGHPGIIAFPPGDILKGLREVALQMMRDCERQANEIRGQIGRSGVYFRFSVDQGAQLNEVRRDERAWILDQTSAYLAILDTVHKMEDYIETARTNTGSISLKRLAGSAV